MKITYPLWYCITAQAGEALKRFQKERYGLNLEVPPLPYPYVPEIESSEELEKIMRRRPKPVRVK